jgi:LytS/YehU family sensor histidine kinase
MRVAAGFGASIIGCLLAGLIFVLLGWNPLHFYWQQFFGSLKIATFMTIVGGAVVSMFETMRARLEQTTLQLRTQELERERALKLATEAQLASLESRIHPHFLFNTLNSISSLIPEDPKRAERLVEQMAALLRFSLDASHSGLVPLSREMKIVTDYLEIERARFGDRLHYRLDIAPEAGDAKVPPLAVQTLVENSVKFAVAPSRAGGDIRIAGVRENGLLRVEVSDDGPSFNLDSAPAGHGLDNLRGRLSTLFGDQAALTLERRENRNSVRLAVPQTGNGHESIPG